MNKLILTVFITCSSFLAIGQKLHSGFGVSALMCNGNYKDSFKVKKETSMRPGFRVYWAGRINLEGIFNLAPEIGYTFKGFRVKSPFPGVAEQEIILHYIDFRFIQEYTYKDKFFAKIGPSISVAAAGRDKQLSTTNLRSNKPLAFNFAEYGRFEGSVYLGVGAHLFNGFFAEIGVNKGISNLWDGDLGPNIKNITYGISVGKYLRYAKEE
jgi:hypothetical protein